MQELPVLVDREGLGRVVERYGSTWTTAAAADIGSYLAAQVADAAHREVVGPLLPAFGGSGVVNVAGQQVAAWADPDVPEVAFSVTKSVVSVVPGLAYDDALLSPHQRVHQVLDLAEFSGPHHAGITWEHLLQQTSRWQGVLWGKPTSADAQSFREGSERCMAPHRVRGGRTTTSSGQARPTATNQARWAAGPRLAAAAATKTSPTPTSRKIRLLLVGCAIPADHAEMRQAVATTKIQVRRRASLDSLSRDARLATGCGRCTTITSWRLVRPPNKEEGPWLDQNRHNARLVVPKPGQAE